MKHTKSILGAFMSLFFLLPTLIFGQAKSDFRIDVDIYEDERNKPVNSTQTIFTSGQYIEIDESGDRITVIEPTIGRITILDPKRKSMVHLEMNYIETQLNRVFSEMSAEDKSKFTAEGEPRMENDSSISLGNKRLRYRFKTTTPSNPMIATSYGDFANWSVRVNALFNKTPPFLRMQLNQLLIDQRQLPAELRRVTVVPGKTESTDQTKEIVALLRCKESLSDDDRTRIASVYKSMAEFKLTSDKEFFR